MQSQANNTPKGKPHRLRPEDINREGGRLPIQQGNLEKVELERLLGKMLKSKKTPVQYKSAMASSLAILKGWNKYQDDNKSIAISDYLHRWAAEKVYTSPDGNICGNDITASNSNNNIYTNTTKQEACQVVATGDGASGGIPKDEASGSGLSPLQIIPAIKSSDATVADNEVINVQEDRNGAGLPGKHDTTGPRGGDSDNLDL